VQHTLVAREVWLLDSEDRCTLASLVQRRLVVKGVWQLEREEHRTLVATD
jgi:hypothetical protein